MPGNQMFRHLNRYNLPLGRRFSPSAERVDLYDHLASLDFFHPFRHINNTLSIIVRLRTKGDQNIKRLVGLFYWILDRYEYRRSERDVVDLSVPCGFIRGVAQLHPFICRQLLSFAAARPVIFSVYEIRQYDNNYQYVLFCLFATFWHYF